MPGYDKDRHVSRVAGSSVHAQPKKGGAGGAGTWGSAMESANYEPVGMGEVQKVTTVAAPVYVQQPVVVQQAQPFQMAAGDFPVLGAPVQAPRTTVWGPVPGTLPEGHTQLSPTAIRPGSVQLFDSSHPRNTFAKKPYHGAPIAQVELAVSSPMASKMSASQFCHNHVSPYAAAPAIPAGTKLTQKQLEGIVGPPQTFAPAPASKYTAAQMPRQGPTKRTFVHQPR